MANEKILLIDDAALMRNILRRLFTEKGYKICGMASSGAEGIRMYQKYHPDLVICDLKMPGMDGLACMKGIFVYDAKARVIICSSQSREYLWEICRNAGAKEYISKPFQADDVIETVERVLDDKDYKQMMMDMAMAAGFSQKEVLDFFDSFRSVTGTDMGDASVNKAYLRKVKDSVGIGAVAFLAAKIPLDRINGMVDILSEICK